MARPFDFDSNVKTVARIRQGALCACCGESLDDVEEHAHHVIPNQSGTVGNPRHAWLREAANCVVLCAPCHDRVHENGKYRGGAVAPPSYFPFACGRNQGLALAWRQGIERYVRSVWA